MHALSRGTERLREGDFSAAASRSRAATSSGELAESFNLMAGGIEDLLREQAEKERLEEELRIARQIQMSLLPAGHGSRMPACASRPSACPRPRWAATTTTCCRSRATRLGVLVADVSGKGTSAALYMAELKGLVLSLSRIHESPTHLLSEANRILAANMDSRSFITMTYAVVDIASGAPALRPGRPQPAHPLRGRTGTTRVLAPPGLGLGLDPR